MLLEGTDIRALLQQVRDSYGSEARIVHAERIRSGGMGGFFAKQRYEVTVEVDADAATTASASAIARSIHEELAAAHDSADSSAVGVQAAPAHAAVEPVAPSDDQHVTQHEAQHVAPPARQRPAAAPSSARRRQALRQRGRRERHAPRC